MPERSEYQPGTPSWVDLGSPDPDASSRFYSELFGWEVHTIPDPEAGGYRMATLRGQYVAGLGPLMAEGQPPAWTTYVSVADAEATAASVRDAGGTVVMEPMDVFDAGRMAICVDPGGAVFALWQPGQHKGAQLVNEPGALCWNELLTRDVDAAKTFYGSVFGWGSDTMAMEGMDYTIVKVGEDPIGGMMGMPPAMPAEVPPHWLVYFAVGDTDAAVAKATELGARIASEPMDVPGVGRMAALSDPHGAAFSVITLGSGDQGQG